MESFNWQTLLWIGGIILFVFVIMRCCGGMMGGRCGVGGRRQRHDSDQGERASHELSENKR